MTVSKHPAPEKPSNQQAPQRCMSCGALVETFQDWFILECQDDRGHEVPNWVALPFEQEEVEV